MRVFGVGYNPDTDAEVFLRDGFQITGGWPEDSGQTGVVLGKTLASLLEVEVGSLITMQTRTSMGSQNALSWPVVGILNAQNPLLDSRVAFLPIDQAMELIVAPGPSQVAVRLDRRGDTEGFLEGLQGAADLGDWQAVSYIEGAEDMLAINKIRRSALKVMIFVLMAIAATGIANTVIMAVYERIREVGTLAAMGMKPSQIRKLFLIEGAVMGFAAALLGAFLGGFANYRLSVVGFSVGDLPDAGAIPISTTIYTTFAWGPIWLGLAFGVFVATAASIWPARFAAGLDPAVAVRDD
jgi:putative ABC transport system permease protein